MFAVAAIYHRAQILLLQRLRGGRAAGGGVQCNMFGEWDPDAEGQLL